MTENFPSAIKTFGSTVKKKQKKKTVLGCELTDVFL